MGQNVWYFSREEVFTPTFGLTKNVNTYNPVKVAFFEWIKIFKDIRKSPRIAHILGYLFGPPGWSHDGSSVTTQQLREKLKQQQQTK